MNNGDQILEAQIPAAGPRLRPVIPAGPHRARLLRYFARETSSGRFIPEIDGLRFVAITMVVLFHLDGYLTARAGYNFTGASSSEWLHALARRGNHGVELFFVISGFILALPFAAHYLDGRSRINLRTYYLRRLTRLEPPYFVAILLLSMAALIVHRNLGSNFYAHLLASVSYLHNLTFGSYSTVIGVGWSLEIEVQFYLLVPLLTRVFALRDARLRRGLLFATVVAGTAFRAMLGVHDARLKLSILGYSQFFAIGFLLADIYVAAWKSSPRRSAAWDLIGIAGWSLLVLGLQWHFLTLWLFPASILLAYCSVFRGRFSSAIFSNPWITATGGMCYSIYLIHYEVISAVARFTKNLGRGLPYSIYLLAQLAIVGAAILAVCGAYFLLIEKPCMQRDWPQKLWWRTRRTLGIQQLEYEESFGG